MKIIKYIFIGAAALMLSSCQGDWLDTEPSSSISDKAVTATTNNAKLGINGLCKMMTRQYIGNGYNGEGGIKQFIGNYPGNNFVYPKGNYNNCINMNYIDSNTSTYCTYPWFYYYKLISNANVIICNIDKAEGIESERQYIKAQALTFRAYSYTMLNQIYGNRWSDSDNGATSSCVLRLDESDGDIKTSTVGEVYEQIYKDLDEAVKLFAESGYKRPKDNNFLPDVNVAYATYARAALNKQDYTNASKYAALARKNFPLMNVKDYMDGFSSPNSEWIWSSYGCLEETLYYHSFFANHAYNSNGSRVRNSPKCISKELYDKIPETDIRRDLFLDPMDDEYDTNYGMAKKNSPLYKRAFASHPQLNSKSKIFAYMNWKFRALELPGVGHLNHFRSSEMLLIEAESAYFAGDEDRTRNLMNELIRESGRNPEYNCEKQGEALLAELKTYRAIELWGEGFDWFDMKRWNDPIIRKSFDDGGNFQDGVAVTIEPQDKNQWTWKIPRREEDFNHGLK